ncbi:MAG TPA: alpha-2-macroglobulin family protein, partial [Thermoanaerobaculia bacterium]|nr:alpha-2-macroglobulin family protein [Thermoanaerobaculia bacterium]
MAELQLADREVHPLVRAMIVLSDLERWHASTGNKDGALEARLERFRQLRRHAHVAEVKALRAELEGILPAYREVPWWATGMAELADLHRSSGDLAAAVRIARAGQEAWPKSPGGERCLALLQQLEAPLYYLISTTSDAPGRRSVQVQHRNLRTLWFRAYEIDLRQRLDQTGKPLYPRLEEELLKDRPAYSWKTELPATPDYRAHTTYVIPPIDKPGAYVIVASGRQDFAIRTGKEHVQNLLVATPLILGDLALVARRNDRNQLEVVALSGSRGEPVPGVEARLYEVSGERRGIRKTGASNDDGILPFDPYQGYAVFARKGNDVALLLSSAYSGERDEETGARSLVFTDRSIYRPQQKVLWKVLVYDDFGEGRFEGIASRSVTVSLHDPNSEAVESLSVTTNGFGTASGEFAIPAGRPLGHWSIETSEKGEATIRVEEYKRPTFEVMLEEPKDALRLGRPANFPGQARYYFGLPVAHGEVKWKAFRQGFLYSWWEDGSGDDEMVATGIAELSADGTFEISFTPEAGDLKGRDPRQVSYLYRIEAELTDEGGETRSAKRSFRLGHVAIEAEISLQDLLAEGEPAKVTIARRDLAGIARPGEATWTLFALRQPAETLPPADLPPAEEERIEKEAGFHTEGDRLRPRFYPSYDPLEVLREWQDGERIDSGSLVHGGDGVAELTLPALAPGAYRLRYETADEGGETFSTWRELIVAGTVSKVTPLALPAMLAVDSSGAEPGGRVRILAHSGFADQLVWLEIWRQAELKERRPLRMGRDASLIEMPIGKEDRGGFSLKLVTLRDHQLMELSADVYVPWDDRRLEVEVATFRDRIRPGSHETWTVKVRPAEGEPELAPTDLGAVELLAYLYDRSLDLFAPHQPADPLDLYPSYLGLGISASSLGRSAAYGAGHGWRQYFGGPDLRKDEIPFRYAFREVDESPMHVGGVVGGLAPPPPPPPPAPKAMRLKPPFAEELIVSADMPLLDERRISTGAMVSQSPPVELRSDFSETAFWQPHLIAGADGTAAIEFDVPDSVTSWSFWVHALTRDLRAGSLQKEVRSVKDLMVRPYVPRFLRENDLAQLEVVINNASEGELKGKVTLDIVDPETGESLLADFGLKASKARASFKVAAAGGTSVVFPLSTPKRVGPVAFKVTATAGHLSDGELRPLPILPSRMHLMQSRFASLTTGRKELHFEDMTKSDPTRVDEQMVVTLDAQLFYSVLESVPYLVDYPYECTEQTLNRFLSTGIVSRVAEKYPAVAAMAEEMSRRETRFETWDAVDPNRKMTLEETPWLALSRGGRDPGYDLIKVLDPRVARAQRDEALGKLQQAQLDSGAFPWWSGGQPSPYMTLYLLYGFAKA